MPYIESKDKEKFNDGFNEFQKLLEKADPFSTEVKLRLAITVFNSVLLTIFPKKLRYYQHNIIVGMLECCSLELQRRTNVTGFITEELDFLEGMPKELKRSFNKTVKLFTENNFSDMNLPKEKEEVMIAATALAAGDLNYMLTSLLLIACIGEYSPGKMFEETKDFDESRQLDLEIAVGLTQSLKLHWYDQLTTPYEDSKIKENGDV